MTDAEIVRVCNLVQKGGKLFVGRDHVGRQKLKVVHGPFGLLKDRYSCNNEDFQKLKFALEQFGSRITKH